MESSEEISFFFFSPKKTNFAEFFRRQVSFILPSRLLLGRVERNCAKYERNGTITLLVKLFFEKKVQ